MEDRLLDDPPIAEMLDDDAFEQLRRHAGVPDAVRIHDDDRAAAANTKAGRFAAFHACGTEQQGFTLEQSGEELV